MVGVLLGARDGADRGLVLALLVGPEHRLSVLELGRHRGGGAGWPWVRLWDLLCSGRAVLLAKPRCCARRLVYRGARQGSKTADMFLAIKNQSVPSCVQLTSRLLPPYPRNPGLWQRAPQLQPCTCQLPPDA